MLPGCQLLQCSRHSCCRGYAPPFLAKGADHAVMQVWTGVLARTDPGMHLLVRGPSNLSWRTDYSVMEGVVAADRWFGPLFTNIRLRKTNSPIVLRRYEPLLQVQPIPASLLTQTGDCTVSDGPEGMDNADWRAFRDTVVKRVTGRKRLGEYATDRRRETKAG